MHRKGIEPLSVPCKGTALPLDERCKNLERVGRIELPNNPWQGFRLPLHHTRSKLYYIILIVLCQWCSRKESNFLRSLTKTVLYHLTTRALVPRVRFKLTFKFLFLRKTTLPICLPGCTINIVYENLRQQQHTRIA